MVGRVSHASWEAQQRAFKGRLRSCEGGTVPVICRPGLQGRKTITACSSNHTELELSAHDHAALPPEALYESLISTTEPYVYHQRCRAVSPSRRTHSCAHEEESNSNDEGAPADHEVPVPAPVWSVPVVPEPHGALGSARPPLHQPRSLTKG